MSYKKNMPKIIIITLTFILIGAVLRHDLYALRIPVGQGKEREQGYGDQLIKTQKEIELDKVMSDIETIFKAKDSLTKKEKLNINLHFLRFIEILGLIKNKSVGYVFLSGCDLSLGETSMPLITIDKKLYKINIEDAYRDLLGQPEIDKDLLLRLRHKTLPGKIIYHEEEDIFTKGFIKKITKEMKAGDFIELKFFIEWLMFYESDFQDYMNKRYGNRKIKHKVFYKEARLKINKWVDRFMLALPDNVYLIIFENTKDENDIFPVGLADYLLRKKMEGSGFEDVLEKELSKNKGLHDRFKNINDLSETLSDDFPFRLNVSINVAGKFSILKKVKTEGTVEKIKIIKQRDLYMASPPALRSL